MKEKTLMLLHYFTGLGIIIAGGIHLAIVFLLSPYEESMAFDSHPFSVMAIYRNAFLATSLEALLILTAYHGFNGLRVILQELHQGRLYTKTVRYVLLVIGLVIVIYGTRTILIAHNLANI